MKEIADLENNIKDEIKRADHLIYVTLKYTRTVDVMKNVIKRLLSALDSGILELLEELKSNGKVSMIPPSPLARLELLEKLLKNEVKDYIKFYSLLRKIDRGEYKKFEEYRKGVMLVVKDKTPIEINVETLKGYFEKTKEFVNFIEGFKE